MHQHGVLIVGEALIDLIETPDFGGAAYLPKVGGAPLNVAVGIARLGVPATLLTALSCDPFSERIENFLRTEGVQLAALRRSASSPTSLAVVSNNATGHAFAFYGHPFAGFDTANADLGAMTDTRRDLVHLGSSLLLDEHAYEVLLRVAPLGRIKTLDPNYRPTLVADSDTYRTRVNHLLGIVDIVKLSEEDARGAYGYSPREFAHHAHSAGTPTVIVTRGPAAVYISHEGHEGTVPAAPTHSVDPTGAGDSFMAALIAHIIASGPLSSLAGTAAAVNYAARAAAHTIAHPGAAESMPTQQDLIHPQSEL